MSIQKDLDFGRIAVALGFIKPEQLAECFRLQEEEEKKGNEKPLAEWLIQQGYLLQSQIETVEKHTVVISDMTTADTGVTKHTDFAPENGGASKSPDSVIDTGISKSPDLSAKISRDDERTRTETIDISLKKNIMSKSVDTETDTDEASRSNKVNVIISDSLLVVPPSPTGKSGKKEDAIMTDSMLVVPPPPSGRKRDAIPNTFSPTAESPIDKDIHDLKVVAYQKPEQKGIWDSTFSGSQKTPVAVLKPKEIEGQEFGRYKILQEIGHGGMGCVYRAYDTQLNRIVALKMLLTEENEVSVVRFLREAKAIARMQHPNIVSVYDIGKEGGRHYFTMDFIDGESLQSWMRKTPPSFPQIVDIMVKIGNGIQYAHEHGIIHRDLKPANVMIDHQGEPKIMDFGLARVGNESRQVSQSGIIIGTLHYMAPEQAEGKIHEIDERSDIYSLGVMFYEMLTGRPPFISASFGALIDQILNKEPPLPTDINVAIPRDLEAICVKALEKMKEKRYSTAKAFVEDLNRFQRGEIVEAKQLSSFTKLARRAKQYKSAIMAAISGAVCILVLTIGIVVWTCVERANKLNSINHQVDEMLRKANSSENIVKKYSLEKESAYLPPEASQEIEVSIQQYMDARILLEQGLTVSPTNSIIRKRLYDVEKRIGMLALLGRHYILSHLFFDRCKRENPEEGELLQKMFKDKKDEVQRRQISRIEEIMNEIKQEPPAEGMADEYTTEILKMQGEHTIAKLISYLKDGNEWQRRIAIESLGKLGDKRTKLQDKDVVECLLDRLKSIDIKKQLHEAELLVWALGRLRDVRSNQIIYDIRLQVGRNTPFWYKTKIPYSWIPVDKAKGENDAKAWYNLGLMKSEKGDWDGAIRDLGESIRMDASYASAYIDRGRAYTQKRNFDEALADYNQAVKLDPKEPLAYLNRGNLYQTTGDWDAAVKDYDEAIRLQPNLVDAYNNRGIIRDRKKDWDGAIDDYTKALSLDSKQVLSYVYRARAYLKKLELEKAMADCDQAIRLNPLDPIIYLNRGNIRERKEDWDGAIDDYNQAIQINPKYVTAYLYRGHARRKKGDFETALIDFNQAVLIDPKDPACYTGRGMVYSRMNDLDKALADYSQVILLNPKNGIAFNNRGWIRYRKGDLDNALQDYLEAIRLNPYETVMIYNVALVHLTRGDFPEAERWYIQAVKKEKEMDRLQEAIVDITNLYKDKPALAECIYFIGFLHDKSGEKTKAIEMLKKYLGISQNEKYKRRAQIRLNRLTGEGNK